MLYGLQAGFHGASVLHELPALKALHLDGVRLDAATSVQKDGTVIAVSAPPERCAEIVNEVRAFGMVPLLICDKLTQFESLPAGCDVQWFNEPDGWSDPVTYRESLFDAADQARKVSVNLWAGSIGNLDRDSLSWLASTKPSTWPANVGVAVNRYPPDVASNEPHKGFPSRDAEVLALKGMIGTRPFGVSEFGYHTAARLLYGFIPWFGITDQDVFDKTVYEWRFWKRHGARFAVAYQITDGPTSSRLDRYGWRRVERVFEDGTPIGWRPGAWKPVASSVQYVKGIA